MKAPGIGIVGLGAYLPEKLRLNSDWPVGFGKRVSERASEDIATGGRSSGDVDPTIQIAMEEMEPYRADPFHGSVERRVAAPGMKSSEMEIRAGRAALLDAHVRPEDLGIVMVNSFLRDIAVPGNAGLVHRGLELPQRVPAVDVDGACGSFLFQLQLASSYLLASGQRYALLVQSALHSPIVDYDSPLSASFGDGATAIVLGRVSPSRGLLSCVVRTDGRYHGVAVLESGDGIPWHASRGGKLRPLSQDPERTKHLMLELGGMAREVFSEIFNEAALSPDDVDAFASHQTIAAYNAICRKSVGMTKARALDTFPRVASLNSASVPFNLVDGASRGAISTDDIIAIFSNGAGMNWGGALFRWGP
ncbi:MAG: 3-oxoacyl-ACP synthase III family protein [Deltaproteobacteria bacterium]